MEAQSFKLKQYGSRVHDLNHFRECKILETIDNTMNNERSFLRGIKAWGFQCDYSTSQVGNTDFKTLTDQLESAGRKMPSPSEFPELIMKPSGLCHLGYIFRTTGLHTQTARCWEGEAWAAIQSAMQQAKAPGNCVHCKSLKCEISKFRDWEKMEWSLSFNWNKDP